MMEITLNLALLLFAFLLGPVSVEEKRWVWEDKKQNARLARYEVVEDERPFASGSFGDADGDGLYEGAQHFKPVYTRPGGIYGQKPKPTGGYGLAHPPFRPAGVIAGPEPTWTQPRPLTTNFDKCKCTEKFNCPSPGISYGHCDTGKQYCCFTSKIETLHGPLSGRPVHSPENGILVGPGGPVDYPRPAGPAYGRPGGGYGVNNGVLAGPSARPIARPPYQGGYYQDLGGAPYSPGIRPRSADEKKRESD